MVMFSRILSFSFLVFALLFFAPQKTFAETVKKNLTIGVSQFPATFHPAIDSMLAKSYVLGAVRRPLTVYDKNWELVCVLCTELPSKQNGRVNERQNSDGETILTSSFTLDKKAVWGDGTPITSQDVYFTWQVGKHPLSGFSNNQLYAKDIADIEIVDEKNFTIVFSKPTCGYNQLNDFTILPRHLEEEIFLQDPASYKEKTLYVRDIKNKGLFMGPYVIKDVKRGQFVLLERNPHWWGKKPFFQTIKIRAIENTASLTASLLSKDIDYIAGELGLTIDQAFTLEKRIDKKDFDVSYVPGLTYEHIALNLEDAFLKNKTARQALLHGLDRKALTEVLFENKQPIAHHLVHPMDKYFEDSISLYDFDREKSAKMLDSLGWGLREDGYRYHRETGEKLRLTFQTTSGNKTREIVSQVIQSDWRRLGIDVSIKNEPPRVFFGKTMRERVFPHFGMFAFLSAPENVPRTTLHSSMIPAKDNGYAGQNFTGFSNKEMDNALEKLETVCEVGERQKLWSTVQKIYAEELPSLPLYFRSDSFFIPTWLKGIEPTGHQYTTTLWIENWYSE